MDEKRKAIIDKMEELGWTVREDADDGSMDICKYSPAGEDFFFTVEGIDIPREVSQYALDFDADEHAEMWVESRDKRGVPESIRTLIDDADAIQEMLNELETALLEMEV